jgi:phosphoribosylaminoimidazole-succinocarboxamide synthase
MNESLLSSEVSGLKPHKQGKVRDIYWLGDRVLLVATDRVSAYDVVFSEGVPGKGKILTQMTCFWFEILSDIIENHHISTRVEDFPDPYRRFPDVFGHRSMLVEKTDVIPVECVVRGYLSGSGWADYVKTGAVCGIALPEGLKQSDRLETPIFTPATKAEQGEHDENISFDRMTETVGADLAKTLKETSLALYEKAADYAYTRGIILADTKFEFGLRKDGALILIDEVFTPDSSRFWFVKDYEPGRAQTSLDKQFIRDYLDGISWDRKPPPPTLPEEVIRKTAEKYREAFLLLTNRKDDFLSE